MVQVPPRRVSTPPPPKAKPEVKKEFRVSRRTLTWMKRLALMAGIAIALLATIGLMMLFNVAVNPPHITNPKLDQDAGVGPGP